MQMLGTKAGFVVPGWKKFNTEIVVDRHIPLFQLLVGRRLNSQELIVCGSVYKCGVIEIKGKCCRWQTILKNADNGRGCGRWLSDFVI